jgi:hypothetical protein
MRGKLLFITGALAGYVLGARAGRQRYEQIKSAANDLWNAPPVQRRVSEVRDYALDAIGDAPLALFGTVKKLVASVSGGKARTSNSPTGSYGNTSSPSVADTQQATAFGTD